MDYLYSEEEIKNIIDDEILFIFDTNVWLDLYSLPKKSIELILDFKLKAKGILTSAFIGKQMLQEEPKPLGLELDENEKKRDVCVNRLIWLYERGLCP